MKLTANFDRDEFGDVPPQYEGNVVALASLLQHFRDLAGVPCIITSAYRSPEHNDDVGGAPRSQHMTASAADCDFVGISNRTFARKLFAAMYAGTFPKFGQVIFYDFDFHVHISLPRESRNNEVLYARKSASGQTVYSVVKSETDIPTVSTAAAKRGGLTLFALLAALALSHVMGGPANG